MPAEIEIARQFIDSCEAGICGVTTDVALTIAAPGMQALGAS